MTEVMIPPPPVAKLPLPGESFPPPLPPKDVLPTEGGTEAVVKTEDPVQKELGLVEIEEVGKHIVNRRVTKFDATHQGKDARKLTEDIKDDPAQKADRIIAWITSENPTPQVIHRDGSTTAVAITLPDRRKVIVTEIKSSQNGLLQCVVDVQGAGSHPVVDISRELVQNSLIIEHGVLISASLPAEQREAFDLYIKSLQQSIDPSSVALAGVDAPTMQSAVETAIGSLGLITGEKLKQFLIIQAKRLDRMTPTTENAEPTTGHLDSALKLISDLRLDEMGLVDGGTLADVFTKSGMIDFERLKYLKEKAQQELGKIKNSMYEKGLEATERKTLGSQKAEKELEIEAFSKAIEISSETSLTETLGAIVEGRGPEGYMEQLSKALERGDTNALLDMAFGYDRPTDDEVERRRRLNHREEIYKKLGKTGGLMALAMAIMMYTAMKGDGKGQ